MAKTKEFERSLLALNPIRLYVGNPARPGGRDTYVITDKEGEVGSTTLNTYYGPGGYTEMDVSPVIRSILGEKLTRAYNPGTSVPSRNPNALDFDMVSDDYALSGISVWGQYSRPYKDEDFSFEKGRFLNPAKSFTYYKGLPWSISALGLKPEDRISVDGVYAGNSGDENYEKMINVGKDYIPSKQRDIAIVNSFTMTSSRKKITNEYKRCFGYLLVFDLMPIGTQGDEINIEIDRNGMGTITRVYFQRNGKAQNFKILIEGNRFRENELESNFYLQVYCKSGASAEITNLHCYKIETPIYTLCDIPGSVFDNLSIGRHTIEKRPFTNWIHTIIWERYPSFSIEIKDAPIDCLRSGSMVYIRYLNRYGGWSYAMLKKLENKLANKSTSVQIQRLSIQPTDGAVAPDRYMVANEVTGSFKAGAGNLSSAEINTLSDIARSIMVDMWDVDNQCFIPIYPKDATVTDNGRNDQEITFEFEFSKEGW